ncbi:MAG: VapC toxin family PIN domain ribonuclease [Actinobacteria bacterium 69-20]|nr:VapC toxin family PIN domain ribonuclease [Actinomycetota bacterium]OJV26520.1 MAG: VapC toxin family PIN domain ribonuclease [Actinobacteria bacterium 69-20]
MILADTSVWITHFRSGDADLARALRRSNVRSHPWIIGELAMGNLTDRQRTLTDLRRLPPSVVATVDEIGSFVERNALFGRGIGFVDAGLLAATALTSGTRLWTTDRRLQSVARDLGLAADSAAD